MLYVWAMGNTLNIFFYMLRNDGVSWLLFLLHFVRWYFPTLAFCFYQFFKHNKYANNLLTPKIWVIPLLSLASYSFYNWLFLSNDRFYVDGYDWQWVALITYSLFFVVQLIVFSRNKIGNLQGFVLTVFACNLSSMIYEIPFFIMNGNNEIVSLLIFNTALFLCLLLQAKYRPDWLLLPALFWLSFCYVIDFLNPVWGSPFWFAFFWLPRLAPIPLFLVIALKIRVWKG